MAQNDWICEQKLDTQLSEYILNFLFNFYLYNHQAESSMSAYIEKIYNINRRYKHLENLIIFESRKLMNLELGCQHRCDLHEKLSNSYILKLNV